MKTASLIGLAAGAMLSLTTPALASPICQGTVDEPRPIPQSLVGFAKMLYGDYYEGTVVYRCVGDLVLICQTGNGFSCDKPSTQRYNAAAERYCKGNPIMPEQVPGAVAGHTSIYLWKCVGHRAVVLEAQKLDERGFRAVMWTPVLGLNNENGPARGGAE